jgi:hypothetical protein
MQRVLAVLVRPTCVSLAVSNPYQTLAEPAGAVMLRHDGLVPHRALEKLLQPHATELAGVVWGESVCVCAELTAPPVPCSQCAVPT